MGSRLDIIRKAEKEYHELCYENHELFTEGSWLNKPAKTVIDLMSYFQKSEEVNILDLGCGVGRNSIPLAEITKEKVGKVVCVDILDTAINKLRQYSRKYNVENIINPVISDITDFEIEPNEFDYIVAVSSLEHTHSEKALEEVVLSMAKGTKKDGINCIINTEVEEFDLETNRKLDAHMEINMTTEQMINKLKGIYANWNVLHILVKPLQYEISRNGTPVLLKTNSITFAVQK